MSFKKYIEPLQETIANKGFEEPLPFQHKILSKIKGGASMFAVAPKGSGKTTSIVISAIQKLKGKALNEAPRVLVLVKDKQAILDVEEEFLSFKEGTNLRIYGAYDKRDIIAQRDDIFYGIDVLITTPDRLKKLMYANGININVLQMFIVEDADFVIGKTSFNDVINIAETLGKLQYLVLSETFDKRFQTWQDKFMFNAQIVRS